MKKRIISALLVIILCLCGCSLENEKPLKVNKEVKAIKGVWISFSELDTMLNDINNVIAQCVDGADPATCEPETSACTGSCSTCGGCH